MGAEDQVELHASLQTPLDWWNVAEASVFVFIAGKDEWKKTETKHSLMSCFNKP